jgi:hypothetical protein
MMKFEGQSGSAPKVIGFENNPKPCCYSFKLTRGDGVLADESLGVRIFFYSGTTGLYVETTKTWNHERQQWDVVLADPEAKWDPTGYWVKYECTGGAQTQYPYQYKYQTHGNPAHRIQPGVYTDVVPYYARTMRWTYYSQPDGEVTFPVAGGWAQLTVSVVSSVPYTVHVGLGQTVSPSPPNPGYNCWLHDNTPGMRVPSTMTMETSFGTWVVGDNEAYDTIVVERNYPAGSGEWYEKFYVTQAPGGPAGSYRPHVYVGNKELQAFFT